MPSPPYTTYASSVLMLGAVVTKRMNKKPIGSKRPRTFGLQAPAGPSTQGGRAARQAILLATADETLVCGWVDFVEHGWDLKNFDAMSAQYKARFGRDFDLLRGEYDSFSKNLTTLFAELKLQQAVGENDPSLETTEEHSVTGAKMMIYTPTETKTPVGVVALIVLLLGAAVVAWLLIAPA